MNLNFVFPLCRLPESGIPVVNLSSVKHGIETVFDCVTNCVFTMESGLLLAKQQLPAGEFADRSDGGDRLRKQPARYSIRLEYSSAAHKSPASTSKLSLGGGGNSSRGDLSRDDEGGFDLKLPPNRFRTRSIAIVAGYSPERLYSNMPPGAFVVESGVYKVGADRDYVKSEPIYWKQVVYGSRSGGPESDGSGTYPRRPADGGGGGTQVLHGPRLVARPNLQLSLVNDSSGAPTAAPLLRASSPLEQGVPLVDWLSPVNNYSDISSVPHLMGSAERSFPSTLLTNPLSSFSSPNFSSSALPSSGGRTTRSGSSGLRGTISSTLTATTTPSSLLLHTIPEDVSASVSSSNPSRLSVTADIHHTAANGATIVEEDEDEDRRYSNLSDYSTGRLMASAAAAPVTPRSSHVARSDRRPWRPEEGLLSPPPPPTQDSSISFPGHQLGGLPPHYYYYYSPALYSYYNNYPAPVHINNRRAISPSTLYPPPPSAAQAAAPHIQPPKDIPDIRVGGVDPKEVDIYQRIAQLDPERGSAASGSVRPLATSSPPGKRKKQEEDSEGAGGQEELRVPPLYISSTIAGAVKPRLPTPPVMMSASRAGPQQPFLGGKKRGLASGSRIRLQTLRELSEAETASSSNAGGGEDMEDVRRPSRQQQHQRLESDLVSVVSEGLDAEVTAITSSSSSPSSPEGSGATNTLQHHHRRNSGNNMTNNTTSSSGIATRSSRNTTAASSSSFSSSGQQNQTLLSSSSGSFSHPYLPTVTADAKGIEEDSEYDSDLTPTYENWPPRPYLQPYVGSPSSPLSQTVADFSSKLAADMTTGQYAVGYHLLDTPPALTSGVPPLTAHYPPQSGRYHARVIRAGSAGAGSANSSLETPSPTSGVGHGRQYSRPNSSQSAPLDRSVDRHYEWDTDTPPATEKGHLAALPPEWAAVVERRRRSPAYNPRRDRDIGPMVQMANRDRVFSDSEIYSNVFPRRGAQRLALDVEARVRAMKREFQEFRQAQQQHQHHQWPTAGVLPTAGAASAAASPPPTKTDSSAAAAAAGGGALDRLESLI